MGEMGGLKSEIVGNKAFFSLSYSEDNRSLLATGADRSIRLYDPRATEGNLVQSVFTSHTGWCSAVQWASVVQTSSCPALTTTWSRCGTREATRRLFSSSQATRTRFSVATGPAVRWSPAVVLTTT